MAGELSPKLSVVAWSDAPTMIAELDQHLSHGSLISLDHDLYRSGTPVQGTGRNVAEHLAGCPPVCPIIIHSRNGDAAWGMYNALVFAGWTVRVLLHTEREGWYRESWLELARRLLSPPRPDPAQRNDAQLPAGAPDSYESRPEDYPATSTDSSAAAPPGEPQSPVPELIPDRPGQGPLGLGWWVRG